MPPVAMCASRRSRTSCPAILSLLTRTSIGGLLDSGIGTSARAAVGGDTCDGIVMLGTRGGPDADTAGAALHASGAIAVAVLGASGISAAATREACCCAVSPARACGAGAAAAPGSCGPRAVLDACGPSAATGLDACGAGAAASIFVDPT